MDESSSKGVEYHLIQRTGKWGPHGWWRPLTGVVTLVVLMFLVVQVALIMAFTVGFLVAGDDVVKSVQRLIDTDNVTPLGLAYLNLSLAAAIPCAMFVLWAFHGLRPRWLASVLPRIRWVWLLVCLGLSLLALIATVVVGTLVPAGDTSLSDDLNSWSSTTRDFVLVVLLLTPLQAAGEEYAFRGYLTQAFGGLFRQRWAAVLFPALLFALAHGAQDAPIFFDRFAFGIVAGVLVIATGGLEAGIAMHVLNNFLAFGAALAYGDMSSALNPTGGTWWSIPVTLTQSLVYLGLAVWMARVMKVRRRTEPAVLERLEARM